MEEGEPLSSLTWARRRLCPFLGASRPLSSLVGGGHLRSWPSMEGCVVVRGVVSSVALAVHGWVVVHEHSLFMSGGLWVVVVCGQSWSSLGGSHSSVCERWQSLVGGHGCLCE